MKVSPIPQPHEEGELLVSSSREAVHDIQPAARGPHSAWLDLPSRKCGAPRKNTTDTFRAARDNLNDGLLAVHQEFRDLLGLQRSIFTKSFVGGGISAATARAIVASLRQLSERRPAPDGPDRDSWLGLLDKLSRYQARLEHALSQARTGSCEWRYAHPDSRCVLEELRGTRERLLEPLTQDTIRLAPGFTLQVGTRVEISPYGDAAPLSYSSSGNDSIAAFDLTAAAADIRGQIKQACEGIVEFVYLHAPEKAPGIEKKLKTFDDRVNGGEKGFYSQKIGAIYGNSKRHLDAFYAAVQDPDIPVHHKIAWICNLADGLLVCATGTEKNIEEASRAMQKGIRAHAKDQLTKMIEQCLLDWIKKEHGGPNVDQSMETHQVNGYWDYLAGPYGGGPRKDAHGPSRDEIGEHRLQRCGHDLRKTVTLARMLQNMSGACREQVQEYGSHHGQETICLDSKTYEEFETFAISLEDRFGPLELATLLQPTADGDTYRLVSDPALLARVIAINLVNKGVLEPFEPLELHAAGLMTIEQVGDAIYVRERDGHGGQMYRSLRASDLETAPLTLRMLDTVLANRRSEGRPDDTTLFRRVCDRFRTWPHDVQMRAMSQVAAQHERALFERMVEIWRKRPGHLRGGVGTRDEDGQALLSWAASLGSQKAVNALLDGHADVNAPDGKARTALMQASLNGDPATVETLLTRGARIDARDAKGWTALMYAAHSGNLVSIRTLLDSGARVDDRNARGQTAVMRAALNGQSSAITMLLARGARIDGRDAKGSTALHYAADKGQLRALEELLNRSAGLNETDGSGWTALMYAVRKGHDPAITMLLDTGADVDTVSRAGDTALMWAAQKGHRRAVSALLDAGARTDIRNLDGETASDIARRSGHADLATLLQGR